MNEENGKLSEMEEESEMEKLEQNDDSSGAMGYTTATSQAMGHNSEVMSNSDQAMGNSAQAMGNSDQAMGSSNQPTGYNPYEYPPVPSDPAELDVWKQQVKLTTFMIHYAKYMEFMYPPFNK
jgi:hypothetical protein